MRRRVTERMLFGCLVPGGRTGSSAMIALHLSDWWSKLSPQAKSKVSPLKSFIAFLMYCKLSPRQEDSTALSEQAFALLTKLYRMEKREAWKGKSRLQLIQMILSTLSNSPTGCRKPGWLFCFRDTNHVDNCFVSAVIKRSFGWLQTLMMTNDIPDSLIRAASLQDWRGSPH